MNLAPTYRDAASEDIDSLWTFLAMAAREPDAAAAKAVPVVAAHLVGWQRDGDFGVVAERSGMTLGAVWARQFAVSEGATFFAGPRTPEISIAVLAEERGSGIGTQLLQRIERAARERMLDGLCLNVRLGNPALHLYQKAGYQLVEGAQFENRAGGVSVGMLLTLASAESLKISRASS